MFWLDYLLTSVVSLNHISSFSVYSSKNTSKSSSRVLEAGVNTLQKTLLLKKKAELDQVDERLTRKRDEFKSRMEDLAHKRSELKLRQQQVS